VYLRSLTKKQTTTGNLCQLCRRALAGSSTGSDFSSWQNFPASPADYFGSWGKNTGLFVIFYRKKTEGKKNFSKV